MRLISILFAVWAAMIFMVPSAQAQSNAVWTDTTMSEPASGTTGASRMKERDVFFYVKSNETQESDWIFIQYNTNIDICFDNDTDAEDDSVATTVVEVKYIPHGNLGLKPSDDNKAQLLLGVKLDGRATQDGSSQDCIYDVKGKGWLKVMNIVPGSTPKNGLISVSNRGR